MRKVRISQLQPIPTLEYDLCHISGVRLHQKGTPLLKGHLRLLERFEFFEIYEVESTEEADHLRLNCHFREVKQEEFSGQGMKLSRPLFDRNGVMVVPAGKIFSSSEALKMFSQYGRLFVKRNEAVGLNEEAEQYLADRAKVEGIGERFHFEISGELEMVIDPQQVTPVYIDARVEAGLMPYQPTGKPLQEQLKPVKALKPRSPEMKDNFSLLRRYALTALDAIFDRVEQGEALESSRITELGQYIVSALVEDKDLFLNLANVHDRRDYLRHHAINTTVLSMGMGTTLGYSDVQVIELGLGALFADIGMLRIDKDIREKEGKLTADEWRLIKDHPYESLKILRQLRDVPMTAPFVAYQSHERIDGSGYPRQRTKNDIHVFAMIVSIADLFDALTSKRFHQASVSPYTAVEIIIREAGRKKFDPELVRAFLHTICLYPVGSWVRLNDGRVGKVVGTNPQHYDRPVVCLMYVHNRAMHEFKRVDLSKDLKLKVVEALSGEGFTPDIMTGF